MHTTDILRDVWKAGKVGMKDEAYIEFNDFPTPITGSFLTNEQAEQFKNAFRDFVQVVRCKDCKHWETESALFGKCELWHLCGVYGADWFCADGERK